MAYKPKHTLAGYKRRHDYVGAGMHEFKNNSLHSGKGGPLVQDRAQAIAISLSMQRAHEKKMTAKHGANWKEKLGLGKKSAQDFNILGHAALAGGHTGYGRSI